MLEKLLRLREFINISELNRRAKLPDACLRKCIEKNREVPRKYHEQIQKVLDDWKNQF